MQETVKKTVSTPHAGAKTSPGVWRQRLFRLVQEALWLGAAYLLAGARMPFGTLPLGPALLCAAPSHLLAVFGGVLLSAFLEQSSPWVYVAVCACLFACRLVIRFTREEERAPLPRRLSDKLSGGEAKQKSSPVKQFFKIYLDERTCLLMCMGALGALALGTVRWISGGFAYYHLFATAFEVLVTPLLIPLWRPGMGEGTAYPRLSMLSRGLFLAMLVWAAAPLSLFGLPLAVILSAAFTFYAASHGLVWGCFGGMLFGIVYSPIMSPAFLLAALVSSFFQQSKRRLGEPLAVLAMSVWGLYAGGMLAFLQLLPAGLLGGVCIGLWQRLGHTEVAEKKEPEPDGEAVIRLQQEQLTDANRRFRGISEAFSSLSAVFYDLSDRRRRPEMLDLRRICDDAFEFHCADCANKPLCWGLEYAVTLGEVNRLVSELHTRGRVGREGISPSLEERCSRIDPILELINRDCSRLTGEMLNNRTRILAMDYGGASQIINDALEEDREEYRFDRELEKRVAVYLEDAGIGARSVTVWGKRRMQILVRGVGLESAGISPETLREDLGEMCGMELTLPAFRVEGGNHTMVLRAKERLSVLGAKQGVSHENGVSGDSINLFSNKEDYFYALLCDGMGSGEDAAFTSGLCSVFLEKMLRAGNRAGTSLRMLNNLICSREAGSLRECSSTVDLLELDLITGAAVFFKSGACPTFILREGTVRCLQTGTAPLGILPGVEASATRYDLKTGDTVVLVSDGILWEDPEGRWVWEYLQGASGLAPKQIAAELCRQAAARGIHDDSSVIVLRILGV